MDRLTPRQQDVLFLSCTGKSDKEIADVLGVSPVTVRSHLTAIYRLLLGDYRGAGARMRACRLVWKDLHA